MAERTSRSTHEIYVGDNPPTTRQLFRLAAQSMSTGRTTNTARTIDSAPHVHYSIQEAHYLNDALDGGNIENPTEMRHRIATRVGRRSLNGIVMPEWSLKFFDTRWYERPNGDWSGVRSGYRFEWIRDTVTLAERRTVVVPHAELPAMDDYLDDLAIGDTAAQIVSAELQMAEVTADDCEQLIADAAEYYGQHVAFFQNRRAA